MPVDLTGFYDSLFATQEKTSDDLQKLASGKVPDVYNTVGDGSVDGTDEDSGLDNMRNVLQERGISKLVTYRLLPRKVAFLYYYTDPTNGYNIAACMRMVGATRELFYQWAQNDKLLSGILAHRRRGNWKTQAMQIPDLHKRIAELERENMLLAEENIRLRYALSQ